MKVCLLSYEIGKSTGKGMERYGAELYDGLLEAGVEVELVNKGCIKTPVIHDNLVVPSKVIRRLGKGYVFHSITPRQAMYIPFLARFKNVVTIPDIIPLIEKKMGDSPSPLLASLYGRYVYSMAKKSKLIITISHLVKNELVEHLGINESKIRVINFGINKQFRPVSVKKKTLKIGYIGGLAPRKRVGILIKSFKIFTEKYPDIICELDIYGPKEKIGINNEYQELLKMVKKMKLNNVFFKGIIRDWEIVLGYNSFDVFVFPTIYEGFGMPIIEAQRCGIPVITMKDGKIPDEVVKETLICLDEEDVAEKIHKLLTNKNFRNKISRQGFKYSQKFTWDKCINETIKVYNELIS